MTTSLDKVFPVDFFLHYPAGYYLRHTLPKPRGNRGAFFISETANSLLIEPPNQPKRNHRTVAAYYPTVAQHAGCPHLGGENVESKTETAFQREILKRHRLDSDGRFIMVIDTTDSYLNLHTVDVEAIKSNLEFREMLAHRTAAIIPTWEAGEKYRWELLGPDFSPASDDRLNAQLIVVGFPTGLTEHLINWTEKQEGFLNAIIPAPIAVAGWFRDQVLPSGPAEASAPPLQFLLYWQPSQTVLFTFFEGKCTNLKCMKTGAHQPPVNLFEIKREIEDITREKQPGATPPLYLWTGEAELPSMNPLIMGKKLSENAIMLDKSLCSSKQDFKFGAGDVRENSYPLDWAIQKTAPETS